MAPDKKKDQNRGKSGCTDPQNEAVDAVFPVKPLLPNGQIRATTSHRAILFGDGLSQAGKSHARYERPVVRPEKML